MQSEDEQQVIGTIFIIRLFNNVMPLTAGNFHKLCTGMHGYGCEGLGFNHIIPQFIIQGGSCGKLT